MGGPGVRPCPRLRVRQCASRVRLATRGSGLVALLVQFRRRNWTADGRTARVELARRYSTTQPAPRISCGVCRLDRRDRGWHILVRPTRLLSRRRLTGGRRTELIGFLLAMAVMAAV